MVELRPKKLSWAATARRDDDGHTIYTKTLLSVRRIASLHKTRNKSRQKGNRIMR